MTDLALIGHEQLISEDTLMRAADHHVHGQMRPSAAAIIVAEHTSPLLGDEQAWTLFQQLGETVVDRIASGAFGPLLRAANQRAEQLLHHLIHGRPPETPDSELLAVANVLGVVRPHLRPVEA